MKLTKTSKEMITFFLKNKLVEHDNQTINTKQVITHLHEYIIQSHAIVRTIQYHKTNKKINFSKPSLLHFPTQIETHLKQHMCQEVCYSFSINNRKIKVYFISERNENVHQYIEPIALWLSMIPSSTCAKTLSVYIYLTSHQKQLPLSKTSVLDEINVNSAYTTSCPVDSEIIIFRKEEWLKVFIHETFHNFNLDFSMMNNDSLNACILEIFNVPSKVNAYEAYSEFWAEFMNCLFCSYFMLKNKNNLKEFIKVSESYLNYERSYSLFQMVKILDYMGLQYSDLYSTSKKSSLLRENQYKEKTNVLSYYILKTILLINYQDFLKWSMNNNDLLFYFKKTVQNQMSFCHFIKRKYKSLNMNNMNNMNIYDFYINKKKEEQYIFTNMRMSICELELEK